MPTGYTEVIANGATFSDFAMRCARNFGACISMRDLPLDAEIPVFTVGSYYAERIAQAENRMAALCAMSPAEADMQATVDYNRDAERVIRSNAEKQDLLMKYRAMLLQVEAWEPPTETHVGVKAFMRSQIELSMEDCEFETAGAVPRTGEEWLRREKASARANIEHFSQLKKDEERRVESGNLWVHQLRESLEQYERNQQEKEGDYGSKNHHNGR